jgi:uncharacterized protein
MDAAAKQLGQGVAFPVRVGPDGSIAWSAGNDSIVESIQLILMTNQGERVARPEFGASLRTFIYSSNTGATRRLIQEAITTALKRWEKRITVSSVLVTKVPEDEQALDVTIGYQIRSTGAREQLSLQLPLADGGR